MITPDPQSWSIATLSKAFRKKEISPAEITLVLLERIEIYDAKINSFITVLVQQALKAARQAEKEILKGRYRGPLHGIPFAVKDLFFTKGIRTTCGSKILANFFPTYNAAVVERLLSAGAILLGKLNMHEFAYGTTSVNPHYGAVRNPWDRERITGGSSGGSAAALVCSFVPLTLGTDTGGSIRIPSALCGTVGLKPTYGRISKYGVYPLCWSLDHPGPMAKSVSDLAMAMNILAGHDPKDPSTPHVPVPDYAKALVKDLKGIRLGIPDNFYFERLEPEVESAVWKAIRGLKKMGAKVQTVSIPRLPEFSTAAFIALLAEGASSLEKWHRTRYADLGEDVRARLNLGAAVKAAQYLKAQRIRQIALKIFGDVFTKVDALITPQLPITAPRIGQETVAIGKSSEAVPSALTRFTRIFNLIGLPALSIPCGFSSSGLPIGLQIVAKAFNEEMVLKVGYAYEVNTSWNNRQTTPHTLHPSFSQS